MKPQQKTFPPASWDPAFHAYLLVQEIMDKLPRNKIHVCDFPDDQSPEFKEELDKLLTMQQDEEERENRRQEIYAQDRNILLSGFDPRFDLQKLHPKTYEIACAMRLLGSYVIGSYKAHFNRARPTDYLKEPFTTIIDVPGHPAYPSGHSTQAHLVAYALIEIIPGKEQVLKRVAGRIAENREWAGVHYRSDSVAGQKLAKDLLSPLLEPMNSYPLFQETLAKARTEW
jgi:hypothetical protein